MKSPRLYMLMKIPMRLLVDNEYNITLTRQEKELYNIAQQDNQLFRHIRNIANSTQGEHMKDFVFVDCKGFRKDSERLGELITDGFTINNQEFVLSERSASMGRNAILGFVSKKISKELEEIVTMGLELDEVVISKYSAYRGLLLSSSFSLGEYRPKIIIIPDYIKTIKQQEIKYLANEEIEYVDKHSGELKKWKQKKVARKKHDVELNIFDGAGIHHPDITKQIQKIIEIEELPTSLMWRAPFIKGVTHSFDYQTYLESKGIDCIIDIFGVRHSIYGEPMIIMTESMYKGYKYFYQKGDKRDWLDYWARFDKYNHVLGIAKWNYSFEKEPVMTRMNYQVLQTLDLEYEEFSKLAEYSLNWAYKIINGDDVYTYAFLGLFGDTKKEPKNEYMQALLKDNRMLKDPHIKNYLNNLIKKKINDFKWGKIWINGTFKLLAPDLFMLCEWAGGIKEPQGVLKKGEFYANSYRNVCVGTHVLERNPHISASESVLLKGVDGYLVDKYVSHLANTLMINGYDITTARLSGADFDGDLVLLSDNEIIIKGVHEVGLIPIIDIEDKITTAKVKWNKEELLKSIVMSFDNRIGELSNIATCYLNKNPKTKKSKDRYDNFIDFISVANGKEIDSAKSGVKFHLPRYIAKYKGFFPYFMQFISDYYARSTHYNLASSNMNRMAKAINKFERSLYGVQDKSEKETIKNKDSIEFDYTIMQDKNVIIDPKKIEELEILFKEFNKIMYDLKKENQMAKNYSVYKNYYSHLTREELMNSKINWKYYYNMFYEKAQAIMNNTTQTTLATYLVEICYKLHPKKNKGFAWGICPQGIIDNIKQQEIKLPVLNNFDGQYEYLGRLYDMKVPTV